MQTGGQTRGKIRDRGAVGRHTQCSARVQKTRAGFPVLILNGRQLNVLGKGVRHHLDLLLAHVHCPELPKDFNMDPHVGLGGQRQ